MGKKVIPSMYRDYIIINDPNYIKYSSNKYLTYDKIGRDLRNMGVYMPNTMRLSEVLHSTTGGVILNLDTIEKAGIRFPMILKPMYGKGGKNIHLANDYNELVSVIKKIGISNVNRYLVQNYIAKDKEIRVHVFHNRDLGSHRLKFTRSNDSGSVKFTYPQNIFCVQIKTTSDGSTPVIFNRNVNPDITFRRFQYHYDPSIMSALDTISVAISDVFYPDSLGCSYAGGLHLFCMDIGLVRQNNKYEVYLFEINTAPLITHPTTEEYIELFTAIVNLINEDSNEEENAGDV